MSMTRRDFMGVLARTGLLAALPLTARAIDGGQKTNVLFIAVDDLRPELGCYGHPTIKSPNIDRLAAEGLVFEHAYCQQAICMSSRASLLSGYRPDKGGICSNGPLYKHVPDAHALNTHFQENGYETVSLGKIYHHHSDNKRGWDLVYFPRGEWKGRGYMDPESQRIALEHNRANPKAKRRGMGPAYEGPDVADNAYGDGMIADEAIRQLQRLRDGGKPFFLATGFLKPHLPFNAPKRYWDMYRPEDIDLARNPFLPKDAPTCALTGWGELRGYHGMPKKGNTPDALARELIHGYYACVSYTDAQIGRVLDELQRLGLRERTIVILWGDHGWKLGDHSMWCKHTNFEIDTHVPMMISVPGMGERGKRTKALVEYVDIYPSLCELTGLPKPEHLEGTSFAPLLSDVARPWKRAAFSQYPRRKLMGYSMRTDRYRYTEWQQRKTHEIEARELYDHQADPDENTNIAGSPENADLVQALSAQLKAGWQAARPKSR